jgi:hypothetical protein
MSCAVAAALASAPELTDEQAESLAALLTRNWTEDES